MTILSCVVAFLITLAATLFWKRFFGPLPEFPVQPGPWFGKYARDWARARNIREDEVYDHITSAVIDGTNGYIFATETPEWDRGWFNKNGWEFPRRWIPMSALDDYQGFPGEVVKLDV